MNAIARVDTRPTMPTLPDSLRRLAWSNREARFPADGSGAYYVENPRWEPPIVSGAELAEIRDQHLPALEVYLQPADPKLISGRIMTLLAHYWMPELPAALHQAMATDWVEALSGFPAWAIERAAKGWLRTQSRRPTIAALTQECEDLTRDARSDLRALARVVEASERQQSGGAA